MCMCMSSLMFASTCRTHAHSAILYICACLSPMASLSLSLSRHMLSPAPVMCIVYMCTSMHAYVSQLHLELSPPKPLIFHTRDDAITPSHHTRHTSTRCHMCHSRHHQTSIEYVSHTHIYMHIHIHTHTHTCTCTYTYIHMHIHIHDTHTYIST